MHCSDRPIERRVSIGYARILQQFTITLLLLYFTVLFSRCSVRCVFCDAFPPTVLSASPQSGQLSSYSSLSLLTAFA